MPQFTSVRSLSLVLFSFLLAGLSASAQTTSLSLASGSAVQGSSLSLNLSLTTSGGSAPSALQWTLGYSPGSIGSINVAAGPALTPAGWTLTCQASSGTVICIAIGMGDTVIAGGTVAIVTVGLGSAASGSTVPMSVSGTLGALPNGTGLAVTGTGGTITVLALVPVINSATTASGTVGSAFSYQIAATNSPTSYAATGLPAGLSVNTTTGLLSGTPTAAGTSTVTLSATNSGGTGSATLTLTVTAESPVITSATTASGTVGSTFSYQIVATNSPTSYAATGLPAGLSFSTTTGLISGTPTAAGTSTVKLRATNSDGTGKATLTLTIARRSDTVPTTSKGIGPSEVQPQNTVTDLFCTPKIITAGSQATCELRLASTSAATPIQVTSNSGQVKAPSAVLTRASQTHLTFQVIVDAAAKEQVATITAMAGPTTAEDTIQVKPSSGPVLIVPGTQAARLGKALGFTVTAVDPNGLSVQLTASDVPAGASFDAANGLFEWIPSASQSGKYKVTFGATNSGGQSSSVEVRVNVSSGVPSVASAERLMCSPGALASLNGSGFAEPSSALSDPSGQSVVLGDTRVRINDQYVPVLAASDARVTFLCPTLEPDTQLEMTVETDAGISEPLRAKMQEATPMIFSLDGSGQNQGVISFAETTDLVMARNFRVPAHPAQPGDEILIWCSGLGLPSQVPTVTVLVEVGGVDAEVESVHAVPGHVGVYTIQARVPAVMNFGDAVPVQVRVNTLGGKQFNSNPVRVAVELVSQ